MNEHMKDERIMAALSVMMGMGGPGAPGGPGDAAAEPAAPAPAPPPAPEPAPPPRELTEEEKEKLAIHEKAEVEKKAAAELYKQAGKLKKDPEAKTAKVKEALEGFTRAAEIEPTNMAYLNNRAACMFELKQYDECREECKKAVELGRSERADYQMIAKALARAGNCHFANEEYKEALEFYEQALLEDYDDKVYRKKMDAKKKLKAKEAAAFLSPEKAEEEKEKGNEKFKEGDFHGALKHYTEAIARDPKNHKLYSNRCAAFQKIGQMPAALEDCEKCIAIDPTFVKIYNRKGNIQFFLKEYHKCTETFQKVIDLEPVCLLYTEYGAVNRTRCAPWRHFSIVACRRVWT
jgi:stress-induced-phosphoprotein 1